MNADFIEKITMLVNERVKIIIARREEVLSAFIAKYGYEPDEMYVYEQPSTGRFWVEKRNKWISVNDKLPDNDNQVMCYGEEKTHNCDPPFKTGIYLDGHWRSDHFCESSYIEVTHWMPLPKPPEENK